MKILQGDVWKRRGVSLLWGSEALSALATATRLAPGLLAVREARADVFQARGQTARAVGLCRS